MKRAIPVVLAAAVALSACGSSSPGGAPSSAGSHGRTVSSSGAASATPLDVGNPASPVTLTEDGSSLLEPFLAELVDPLRRAYPNLTLSPAAGGSGKGISDATSGVVDLGGSDAYLSPSQMAAHPGLVNIPVAVSGQAIDYNLPGLDGLHLTGSLLARIYEGHITEWDDPAIRALNPQASLPHHRIVPVRRVDSSGDTFLFTSFLAKSDNHWSDGPSLGTTVPWPDVAGELTASGNPGMVETCAATPGCIAYIGVSAETAAKAAGLGEAALRNPAGHFLQPTQATEAAAASAAARSIPENLAASLIATPGVSAYPIVNFEYLVLDAHQASAAKAAAIRTFLAFAVDSTKGSAPDLLAKEDFVALPASVLPQVDKAIAAIR